MAGAAVPFQALNGQNPWHQLANRAMPLQVLLDMSCASGVFSRRFVRSGHFSGVIAADFSDNMLRQAGQFFSEDRSLNSR